MLLKTGRVEALPLAAVRPRRVASRVGCGIFADPAMANPVGAGRRVDGSAHSRQLHNYNHTRNSIRLSGLALPGEGIERIRAARANPSTKLPTGTELTGWSRQTEEHSYFVTSVSDVTGNASR